MNSYIVTFMSYNITGTNLVKSEFIRELMRNCDVAYSKNTSRTLQENFKTVKSTVLFFSEQFSQTHAYMIPAY